MFSVAALVVMVAGIFGQVSGHGRLINPPSRSSMWRYGFNTPVNTNDHQLSCGGFGVMFYSNGGKCGICGDPYNGIRENEAGGKYATGTISRTYKEGEVIPIDIEITVNHGGWFEFRLCPNNNPKKAATEQCLDQHLLKLSDGSTRYQLKQGLGVFSLKLVLPQGLTCSQCVLQWKWNTASNVRCEGSKCCRGCGPQEQFYGCADVSIGKTGSTGGNHGVSGSGISPQTNFGSMSSGFIPVQGSSGNIPQLQPQAQLPDGFQGVPSVICEATAQLKALTANADEWCKTNCPRGNCPKNFCTGDC